MSALPLDRLRASMKEADRIWGESLLDDLFSIPDPKARATDPKTSHDAAASMKKAASHQCVVVLMVLRANGPLGAEEIEGWCGLPAYAVRKRLPELYAAGLVRPTGLTRKTSTGRSERTWEVM